MSSITALRIEKWFNPESRQAQELLPELVRRLIVETVPSEKRIDLRIPVGDEIGLPGPDGVVRTREEYPNVPKGRSVWEFTTAGKNANGVGSAFKSNYEKRVADPEASSSSFVFVTPHKWDSVPTLERILRERRRESRWLDVVVIDRTRLENWLATCPETSAWLLQKFAGSSGPIATSETLSNVEEVLPPKLRSLLDDADRLVLQGQYDGARDKLSLVLEIAEAGSAAALSAHIDLAEIKLFEGSDVVGAHAMLATCRQEVRDSDTKRKQSILTLLGDAEVQLGHVGEAHSLYTEAHELAQRRKNRPAEARALVGLGHAEELRGNLDKAEASIDEAINLYRAEYRSARDDDSRRKAATNLAAGFTTRAHLLTHSRRLAEARVDLESALPLFGEADSKDNFGRTLLLKGELLLVEAKREEGLALLQEARTLFRTTGNTKWECRCLRRIAHAMAVGRDMATASEILSQALALLDFAHWPARSKVPYLLDAARFAWESGRDDDAIHRIEEAKELARQGDSDGTLADCFLAEASAIRGDGEEKKAARLALFEAAIQDLDAALAQCEIRGRRAVYMERLGMLYGNCHDAPQARSWFERALLEFQTIGDVSGVTRCMASIAATARDGGLPDESLQMLERVLEVTKGLPLYYERAGALHDLAALLLSQRNDETGARQCLDEARDLAEKHGFRDVQEACRITAQFVDHATKLDEPTERDLPAMIQELQAWCAEFPSMRDAIVMLWYYFNRTDIWRVCRAALGLKFLVYSDNREDFDYVVQALHGCGDLFAFARVFPVAVRHETESIPVGLEVLIPSHVSVLVFRKRTSSDSTKAAAQATDHPLKDRPYVLMFGQESHEPRGTTLHAFGCHMRLPDWVRDVMLDPAAISMGQVCLPLGQSLDVSGGVDTKPDTVDLRYVMLTAWDNGMIPIFVGSLPAAGGVKVIAKAPVLIGSPGGLADRALAGRARIVWSSFARACRTSASDALAEFRDSLSELTGDDSSNEHLVRAAAYAVEFRGGDERIAYPMIAIHRDGPLDVGDAS